jgi:hypothetical protein
VSEAPHLTFDVDPASAIVRAVRTRRPLASAHEIDAMTARAREALHAVARGRYGVLVDLRASALAEETDYADEMRALRHELTRGFRRSAFLVETKVGALQTRRFVREERLAVTVFEDERLALDFLRGA